VNVTQRLVAGKKLVKMIPQVVAFVFAIDVVAQALLIITSSPLQFDAHCLLTSS
jgi:hypothetical protein